MSIGFWTICWFLFIAVPAKACGPRTGFKIKNMALPLPTLKLDENIQGMDARVIWTSEVSFRLYLKVLVLAPTGAKGSTLSVSPSAWHKVV